MSPALTSRFFTTQPPRKQVLPNSSGYANSHSREPQAHEPGGQQQPHAPPGLDRQPALPVALAHSHHTRSSLTPAGLEASPSYQCPTAVSSSQLRAQQPTQGAQLDHTTLVGTGGSPNKCHFSKIRKHH